jgi:hypothetical protein
LTYRLRRNTREFDAEGRVLRLKRFIPANCRPQVIDAVLDALRANTRVEVLYIQNFEQGFGDEQLRGLLEARPACPAGLLTLFTHTGLPAGLETGAHLGCQCR